MAEAPAGRTRLLLAGGALVVVVLLTLLRGPVVLLAAATVVLTVALVTGLLPLLRTDGVDWGWLPDRAEDVPPEPGIATLHRTLLGDERDTAGPARLQDLVRGIAEDRAPGGDLGDGALARYLGAPPRRLRLDEVDALVRELEALTPAATASRATSSIPPTTSASQEAP